MDQFVNSVEALLSADDHHGSRAVIDLLGDIDFRQLIGDPSTKQDLPPACDYLDAAFKSSNQIEIARELLSVCDQLRWREASKGKASAFMDGRYAFAEIVGPDASFESRELRFGAFLLAPNTFYPLHSHAADEFYIPISGKGRWRIGTEPYELKSLGSIVHVPSWVPHAIRCDGEPLLMLWAWFGDIDFEAYQIEPDAFDAFGHPL